MVTGEQFVCRWDMEFIGLRSKLARRSEVQKIQKLQLGAAQMVEEVSGSVFVPEVQVSEKENFEPNNRMPGSENLGQGVAGRTSECKRRIFVFWCFFLFARHALQTVPTVTQREH